MFFSEKVIKVNVLEVTDYHQFLSLHSHIRPAEVKRGPTEHE